MILKRKVNIPIYKGTLIVTVFDSEEELLSKEDFGDFNELVKYSGAWVESVEKNYFGDNFKVYLRPQNSPSTIAHEAAHVVHKVFQERGVDMTWRNDEYYTYFLGWVVDELDKTIRKFENKAKIKPQEQLSNESEGDTSN